MLEAGRERRMAPMSGDQERKMRRGSEAGEEHLAPSSEMVQIRLLPTDSIHSLPHSAVQIQPETEEAGDVSQRHSFQKLYRPERGKTLVAFLAIAFSGFFNFFLLTIIHDIVPRQPLPDLAFMLLPQQPWALPTGDALTAILVSVTFALCLVHRYRWLVFRRLFLIAGFLYGLRAAVLAVTFMPPSFTNPAAICIPPANRTEMGRVLSRFADYVITLGLTSSEGKILCGDLMFSGHTVSMTLMYFLVIRYTPRRAWALRWFLTPVCYFGLVTIVISGGHYTMDVLIAYWLTSHLFWAYHQVFDGRRLDVRNAPLTHLWWYWVSVWLEAGVPEGPVPNELSWPLPWPALCVRWMDRLSLSLNR